LNGVRSRISEPITYKTATGEYKETTPGALDYTKRVLGEGWNAFVEVLDVGVTGRNLLAAEAQTQADLATGKYRNMPDFLSDINYQQLKDKVAPDVLTANMQPQDKYDVATGNAKLPEDRIREANKIWYQQNFGTTLLNQATQQEYMRQVMAGENPYEVAEKLQNNWANLIADIVLDPTNVIPASWFTKAKYLDKFADGMKIADDVADSLSAVSKAARIVDDVPAMEKLVAQKLARNENLGAKLFEVSGNPMEFTQAAKSSQMLDKIKVTLGNITYGLKSTPQKVREVIEGLALASSKNADEIKRGLEMLDNVIPGDAEKSLLKLALSRNGEEAGHFLRGVLLDDSGKLSGKLVENLYDFDKFTDTMGTMTAKALKETYPDMIDVVKNQKLAKDAIAKGRTLESLPKEYQQAMKYNVPGWAARVTVLHDTLQNKAGVRAINRFFNNIYLVTTGFGVRNFIMGGTQAAYDFGGEFMQNVLKGDYAARYEDVLGMAPPGEARRLKETLLGTKEVGPLTGVTNWIKGLASDGEAYLSRGVEETLVKRTMRQMLQEGVSIPKYDVLRQAGFTDDHVQILDGLIKKHWGQTDKAMAEFVEQVSGGSLQPYKNIESLLPKAVVDKLHGMQGDLLPNIQKVLDESETAEDAKKGVQALFNDLLQKANKREPGILPSGTELLGDMNKMDGVEYEAMHTILGEKAADLFTYQKSIRMELNGELRRAANALDKKFFGGLNSDPNDPKAKALSQFVELMDNNAAKLEVKKDKVMNEVRSISNDIIGGKLTSEQALKRVRSLPNFQDYVPEFSYDINIIKNDVWNYYRSWSHEIYKANLQGNFDKLQGTLKSIGLDGEREFTELASDYAEKFKMLEATDFTGNDFIANKLRKAMDAGDYGTPLEAIAKKLGIKNKYFQGVNYSKEVYSFLNKRLGGKLGNLNGNRANFDLAVAELNKYADEMGLEKIDVENFLKELDEIKPQPYMSGYPATSGQALKANMRGGLPEMFGEMQKAIDEKFGNKIYTEALSETQQNALKSFGDELTSKVLFARQKAATIATAGGDETLLDYIGGRQNKDLALAYLMPYAFWYSGTYKNWLGRLTRNPAIINWYGKWRNFLEEQNSDLPEYMRNNIRVPIGSDPNNALFFNLEATLNPLNGLTGIDFTDKNKIVGEPGTFEYALTNTLDGIGKYGPSVWTPFSSATAFYLLSKGEKEAASRWGGRLLPQTAWIKAGASLFGKQLELDPFVNIFSDKEFFKGVDPYEARRVGRALITMADRGYITKEQAYEAARKQEGESWDRAVILATQQRAPATFSTFLLGQGFKGRTVQDANIDRFYQDYYMFWQNADKLSADETRSYMDNLRQKYPFMDTVILSNKDSKERDKVYSYAVLNRIPPGQMSGIVKLVGISPNLIDKFYTDKGKISTWGENDKNAWMAGMVEIGTMLSIPQNATQQEWSQAKSLYKQIDQQILKQFGQEAIDGVETYYSIEGNYDDKARYLEAFPKVRAAMDYRSGAIAVTPLLSKYYDGFQQLDYYYKGLFRNQVMSQVDPDYFYYAAQRDMIVDPKERASFDSSIGWSAMYKKYTGFKKEYDMMVDKKMLEYQDNFVSIPDMPELQGNDLSARQQEIYTYLTEQQNTTQPQMLWEEIASQVQIPASLDVALSKYFVDNVALSSANNSMLIRLVNNLNYPESLGITKDNLLTIASRYYQK